MVGVMIMFMMDESRMEAMCVIMMIKAGWKGM